MFNQRNQANQDNSKRFSSPFNAFQGAQPMQISGNNTNTRFNANTNTSHEFKPAQRGGKPSARRGAARGRGFKNHPNRGGRNTSGNRSANPIDLAFDLAISNTPPKQQRRNPRHQQPASDQGFSLDSAISDIESGKGGSNKFRSQQTRLNPTAAPFVSQFQQQQQQQQGSAFSNSPFLNQGTNTSPFISSAFGTSSTTEPSTSAFGSVQHSSTFPSQSSAFGVLQDQSTPFLGQTSGFGVPQENISPFKSQHSSAAPAFIPPPGFVNPSHQSPFNVSSSGFSAADAAKKQGQKPLKRNANTQDQDDVQFNKPARMKRTTGLPESQKPKQQQGFGRNQPTTHVSPFGQQKQTPQKQQQQQQQKVVGRSGDSMPIQKGFLKPKPASEKAKHVQFAMTPSASKTTTAADRAIRFGSTEKTIIYDAMKQKRIIERQEAIRDGLIPDPDAPTRLEEAIDFRGCCESMCPEFEIIEREIQNNIDSMELNENGEVDLQKMVKAYRRSAAGNEQPLPSDVRSADALILSMDYLVDEVLSNNPLEVCHGFIRDRTRSIRQDFTRQNIRDETAIQVFERIARFHIMCLHEMCEFDENKFSHQQEVEQLRKVLISLIEFYDDLREEGIQTENEAEFRAYHIITHFRDQDVLRQTMTLPLPLFKHPLIQQALKFHSLAQRSNEIMETSSRRNKPLNVPAAQNFYTQFFKMVASPDTPFLMACLLEAHFADVRKGALKAMNISYVYKLSGIPAAYLKRILCYDSMKQLLEEAQLYGLVVDTSLNEPTFRFGQKHYKNKQAVFREPLTNPPQRQSTKLVVPKKAGRSFKDIVNDENHISAERAAEITAQNKAMFGTSSSPATLPTMSQPVGSTQDDKTKRFEAAKAAADAAEANLARERQQLEAMMKERLAKEAASKEAERAKQAQLQAQKLEEDRRALAAEAKKREQARLELARLEEERKKLLQQKEIEMKKRREEEEKRRRRRIDRDALAREMYVDILGGLIEDTAALSVKVNLIKENRMKNFIKRKTAPWMASSRAKIYKRHAAIADRNKMWHFAKNISDNNPYSKLRFDGMSKVSLNITEDVREDRSRIAIRYDNTGKQYNVFKSDSEKQRSIWNPINFHAHVNRNVGGKLKAHEWAEKAAWANLIYCSPSAKHSKSWFRNKYSLDKEFDRNVSHYPEVDITTKLLDSAAGLSPQFINNIQAITFALPEQQTINEIHDGFFWDSQKKRLADLWAALKQHRPDIQVPLLITYFPDKSSDLKATLTNIPNLLGFEEELAVTNYHILIMNPDTISTRVFDESLWLIKASIGVEF